MKTILVTVLVVFMLTLSAGAVDVSPYQQILFEMCGAGWVTSAISEIQAYDDGWRAASARGDILDVASARLFVSIMQGGITKVFPRSAILQFLNKLDQESIQYGTVRVNPQYNAPTGCSVVSSNIECDAPPEGKSLILYSWNFVVFSDTEDSADVDGDFDSLASGTYVVGYDNDSYVTTYLTVP